MDFTFLKVHLPDLEFNAPFPGRSEEQGNERTAAETDSAATEAAVSRIGPLFVLVTLAGLALMARYLEGGRSEQSTLDEVEA
jgi:hypothetical protein